MPKKRSPEILIVILSICMSSLSYKIQLIEATGTIYIMADGSVYPETAPIQRAGNAYTFTANIYDEIVVFRENITIDGKGHLLEGSGTGMGFYLSSVNNVTIRNTHINNFESGIYLYYSSRNIFYRNEISNNRYGIELHGYSDTSTIYENEIKDNSISLWLCWASNNVIFHNNIIGGHLPSENYPNILDDGYPSGRNYWDGYDGKDVKKGSGQDRPGSDGIGDTSYVIDDNNRDRYPLMFPYGSTPPPTYILTINPATNGTTDPAPGAYAYSKGQDVPVQAIPDEQYCLEQWELDEIGAGSSNPINVVMDSDHNLSAMFTLQTYDVTIMAHCNTEGTEVSVSIIMDGLPTSRTTPHTFIDLAGTHNFTVPSTDTNEHSFRQWNTGVTNTTITVDSNGAYVAYYHTVYILEIESTTGGNTDPLPGIYTHWSGVTISVIAMPETGNYLDYWEIDGTNMGSFNPIDIQMEENHTLRAVFAQLSPGHDVAIKGLSTKTATGQGYHSNIKVLAMNVGNHTETFNVTAYIDNIPIATKNVTLESGNSETPIFMWNTTGFEKGNYTTTAYAHTIPYEMNTADNNSTDCWVVISIIGDITGAEGYPDGKCDMRDVGLVARHFGQTIPPAPVDCDLTGPITGVPDGKVDMRDVGTVARHFGEIDP